MYLRQVHRAGGLGFGALYTALGQHKEAPASGTSRGLPTPPLSRPRRRTGCYFVPQGPSCYSGSQLPGPQRQSSASSLSPHGVPPPCSPRPLGVDQEGLNEGNGPVLSAWSQQALQLLISSLPRPGEGQTAADKSPRGAAKGAGRPPWETEHLDREVSSATPLRAQGGREHRPLRQSRGTSGRGLSLRWASQDV